MDRMDQARAKGENYRIAVLGRTRNALAPIAKALREAAIPFRAVDAAPFKPIFPADQGYSAGRWWILSARPSLFK